MARRPAFEAGGEGSSPSPRANVAAALRDAEGSLVRVTECHDYFKHTEAIRLDEEPVLKTGGGNNRL